LGTSRQHPPAPDTLGSTGPAAPPGLTHPGAPCAPQAGPLAGAYARLWERILAAQCRYGREPGSVALVAVSKTFSADIVAAATQLGQHAFGENYVQEAVAKIAALRAQASGAAALAALQWHFIGPIQSNKTRHIAANFQWVQSLDRLHIAQRLSGQRPPAMVPLQILLEVNLGAEATKSGIAPDAPGALAALALEVARLPNLVLRGLMAIPRPQTDVALQRAGFAGLRARFEEVRAQLPAAPDRAQFDTLSMGMSADFEAAIAEGATMIRVGSALFGART